MRKLRIRPARAITVLAWLGTVWICANLAAPGFTFYGRLYVDLTYPDGVSFTGEYPSVWRLRFNKLSMGEVTRDDLRNLSHPGFPTRPMKPVTAPPLDPNLPLTMTFNGTTYHVGQLTPAQIAAMGGRTHMHTDGLTFGSLPLHTGNRTYPSGTLRVIFIDDQPVSFSASVWPATSEPVDLELSYRGGPALRLPASRGDIIRSFGVPSSSEERLVLPDKGAQPMPTLDQSRFLWADSGF